MHFNTGDWVLIHNDKLNRHQHSAGIVITSWETLSGHRYYMVSIPNRKGQSKQYPYSEHQLRRWTN